MFESSSCTAAAIDSAVASSAPSPCSSVSASPLLSLWWDEDVNVVGSFTADFDLFQRWCPLGSFAGGIQLVFLREEEWAYSDKLVVVVLGASHKADIEFVVVSKNTEKNNLSIKEKIRIDCSTETKNNHHPQRPNWQHTLACSLATTITTAERRCRCRCLLRITITMLQMWKRGDNENKKKQQGQIGLKTCACGTTWLRCDDEREKVIGGCLRSYALLCLLDCSLISYLGFFGGVREAIATYIHSLSCSYTTLTK